MLRTEPSAVDVPDAAPTARALIEAFDWGTTPLGARETWSSQRHAMIDLALRSRSAIATLWGDTGILIYNDIYAAIIGARHPAALGMPVAEAFPEVASFNRAMLERVGRGEALRFGEQDLHLHNGVRSEQRWFNLSYTPIVEAGLVDGVFALVVETTGDVSERDQVEQALRQAQKMEAIGQLTGGISHDFNNLLAGIIGNLDMLATRLGQNDIASASSYLDGARSAASRAAGLTQRLLAFSRRQTLMPSAVPVADMLADMEELIGRTVGPGIAVSTQCDEAVWTALCDHNQLENALLNLAINARDAMPSGGRLTITACNRRLDPPERGESHAPGEHVLLTIADTGAGMTEDVVARAFEPFFTTKPSGRGTGLGLSMVYGFVKQSGGHIELESAEGAGTIVRLFLPRDEDVAMTAGVAPSPPVPAVARDEVVLIVDDEPDLRIVLAELLGSCGFTVREAGEADGALAIIEEIGRIDLLIADIGLRGRMDGKRLVTGARALRPALKVLFITGFAEPGETDDIVIDANTDLLLKPFSFSTLAQRVDRLVSGQQTMARTPPASA